MPSKSRHRLDFTPVRPCIESRGSSVATAITGEAGSSGASRWCVLETVPGAGDEQPPTRSAYQSRGFLKGGLTVFACLSRALVEFRWAIRRWSSSLVSASRSRVPADGYTPPLMALGEARNHAMETGVWSYPRVSGGTSRRGLRKAHSVIRRLLRCSDARANP